MPTNCASRLITGVLSVSLLAAPVVAQVDENAPVDESGEAIEELVVVGTRPGERDEVDPVRKEFWRQQMFDSVELMRLEEEEAWRNSELTYESGAKSRMVWGYDPGADRDMYSEFDFNTNPGVTTKPATLFRARF